MNTGYSPRYIAMAVPNLIECVPTSSYLCPVLPLLSPTVSVNAFIMWVDVTCARHSLMVTVDVEIGESWDMEGYFQILLTIAAAALSRQRQASCEAIRVTVFIFSSFFCSSKVRAMESSNSSSKWSWSSCLAPLRNRIFLSLRISVLRCLGFDTLRYSQEPMAKNTPTLLMMEMGIAFWCFFLGLYFWTA